MSQAASTGSPVGDMHVAAPPWEYNPSSWRQRLPICALAMVGAIIAAYLAAYQWRLIPTVWDPIFGAGTATVLDSNVSEQMRHWMRIPDAALGAIAYFSEAVFGLAGSSRRWQYRPWLVTLFGIDVIPLGVVSIVLVMLQGMVVGAWCTLCLATAAISLLLIWLAYDEVWSSLLYVYRVWKRTGDKSITWDAFWGRPTPEAIAVAQEMIEERRR